MATKIFVNLPVKDVQKSIDFFTAVGYTFNQQFSNESSACMIVSEDIMFMLLSHERFADFAPNGICDTSVANEALLSLSCESRDEVDAIADKAEAAGAMIFEEASDLGFMYSRSYIDLDGHGWNLFWMDPNHVMGG